MLRVETQLGRKLSWALVATVGLRVLRGLAAAHERRLPDNTVSPVVHRDVSPQNILLALNGDIKLADFGMARARDRIAEHTAPGFVKGTLSYMAPEILVGKPATPVSDLFSVATTLWEASAGQRLFHAKSDMEVIERIRQCHVPPLAELRPDAPPAFIATIHRALSLDPGARFVSARQMAHEFGEILREGDSWGDADVLVGNAVAEARIAQQSLPPPPAAPGSGSGSGPRAK
jgi:serine/threonine-protein kinase